MHITNTLINKINAALVIVFFMFFSLHSKAAISYSLGSLPDTQPASRIMTPTTTGTASGSLSSVNTLPSELNYVNQGIVTPVKDQGSCGSCTIFATTAALESFYKKNNGVSDILSEQRALGCLSKTTNICQNGSTINTIANYLTGSGTTFSSVIPYTASINDGCSSADNLLLKYNNYPFIINTVENIGITSNVDLKSALFAHGPVAVSFNVMDDFFNYKTGVYLWDNKSAYGGGHAVLVVGYSDSQQAFLVKNSWSSQWGG